MSQMNCFGRRPWLAAGLAAFLLSPLGTMAQEAGATDPATPKAGTPAKTNLTAERIKEILRKPITFDHSAQSTKKCCTRSARRQVFGSAWT